MSMTRQTQISDPKRNIKRAFRDCRGGFALKSSTVLLEGSKLGSQHPWYVSHNCLYLQQLGHLKPLSDLCCHLSDTNMTYTLTYTKIKINLYFTSSSVYIVVTVYNHSVSNGVTLDAPFEMMTEKLNKN